MLIINCPWCGKRPEIEFRYGGEAHIARPADPSTMSDAEWADFLYNRTNPKGKHRRALAPHPWLRRASSMRCATP